MSFGSKATSIVIVPTEISMSAVVFMSPTRHFSCESTSKNCGVVACLVHAEGGTSRKKIFFSNGDHSRSLHCLVFWGYHDRVVVYKFSLSFFTKRDFADCSETIGYNFSDCWV